MKRIIATTAMALMLTTSAFADAHSNKMMTYEMEMTGDIYASELIGMRIYSAEKDYDTFNADTMVNEGAEKEWDDLGEVNDVILGRDGKVKAVILGVGGFIGIGEKDIAVQMDQIKFVAEKDDKDDYFLVVKTNKEALTESKPFVRMDDKEMKKQAETQATSETTMVKSEERMDADGRKMLMTPAVERDGYRDAEMEEITTEQLTGARVYGSNDEDVGEIDRLIVGTDGKIKHAIVDVGGFLGLGEHSIAVTMDELKILRENDGDDIRIFIDATQAELEKQPKYKG